MKEYTLGLYSEVYVITIIIEIKHDFHNLIKTRPYLKLQITKFCINFLFQKIMTRFFTISQ